MLVYVLALDYARLSRTNEVTLCRCELHFEIIFVVWVNKAESFDGQLCLSVLWNQLWNHFDDEWIKETISEASIRVVNSIEGD